MKPTTTKPTTTRGALPVGRGRLQRRAKSHEHGSKEEQQVVRYVLPALV